MPEPPLNSPIHLDLDQPETGGGGLNVVHPNSGHSSTPRMIAEDQEPISRFTVEVARL
jgi:hypothetical protein